MSNVIFKNDFQGIQKKERILRDDMAHQYEEWIFTGKGKLWDKMEKETIIRAVDPKNNEIILDAGCGVGLHSLILSKKAKRIFSMDFSMEVLKY